ncbi:sensor histidine kinase [Alteromonas naphthalenivorans]|uniref:histidine kinase n=1 Tax=Alteromonas naphthalenivorans TaxID=715451 RepID=F5Z9T2_ALTNA|nr:ATP-binding protein [Alteromonas naphthalenivorans]AEF02087.1 sensor histidine kinase [Alteromonas naphthalenivorans]
MNNGSYSVEFKVKAGLAGFVIVFLVLAAVVGHTLNWSLLAIVTLLFFLSYPLCWAAWQAWDFWRSSIMRVSAYVQSINMGESGVSLTQRSKSVLIDDLIREIKILQTSYTANTASTQMLTVLLAQLFEDIPIAIVVFDDNFTLIYANREAYTINEISLLQGMNASQLGFVVNNEQIQHPILSKSWRSQSSALNYMQQAAHLFTAVNIDSELKQSEQAVQKNLVRVLSHELRNTLTPMSSMAETILSMQQWDTEQVRKVLSRVKTRSDGLLSFVERFSEVAKIPEPNYEYFDLALLIEQTKVLLGSNDTLNFVGQKSGYGDPQLLAQVLINLVKNAVESVDGKGINIEIQFYIKDTQQHLIVSDNGTGFSNIENAITPLFTTKTNGAGIGLTFVESVLSKHGGKLKLSNTPTCGANVELLWPSSSVSKVSS